MISPITNNKNNLCFKELLTQISSQENKVIADSITDVLLEKYPNDKKGRTFLERANHYNQDVYLMDDENGGVKVELHDRMWHKRPLIAMYNTYIGTYTQPEQFTLNDILSKYNINEKNEKYRVRNKIENISISAIIIALLITVLGALIHRNNLTQQGPVISKNITNVIKTK